jgi:hypothetical protein
MARRSGSATSALRDTLFNPTGKLILKPAELVSTAVIVVPCFPGETVSSPTELSVMLWQRRVLESQQESSMVETAAVVFW